ncbi:phage tail assembly protein [Sphingomonas sp. BE137]|uniref:phage tail assembly protein n=1 Tax=Sphingomonas sp. BE137 TaxID=2817844 RepID=UPI001AE9016B|nr:phage tail assembly protein [Sphingomonas sp. BE137]MDR6850363.1 hypothetical protein [Sphingomonas sp. BE137]
MTTDTIMHALGADYHLLKPIEFAGEVFTKLTFRDCTAGEWAQLDDFNGTESDQRALGFILDNGAGPIVSRLSVRDYRAAGKAMATFLNNRPIVVDNGSGGVSITLSKPVASETGTLAILNLREPTAGDLIAIDPLAGVAKDIAAVTACSGWDRKDVIKLPLRDFLAASAWIADFFDDAPATGA